MKVILILFAIVCVILFGIYHMMKGFNPAEEGQQFREALVEGMAFSEVWALKPAKNYSEIRVDPDNPYIDSTSPSRKVEDPDEFQAGVRDGSLCPQGFVLHYNFGQDVVFDVYFTADRKLDYIDEPMTASDLFTLPSSGG